jgi:hypothetical protein
VVVRGEGQTQSGGGLSFRQRLERGVVQLTTGELDLATAPQLETRLGELKTSRTRVELDLSQLVVYRRGRRTVDRASARREPAGPPARAEPFPVRTLQRLFELVDLGRLVEAAEHTGELRPHFPGWSGGPEGPGSPGHLQLRRHPSRYVYP